MTITLEAPETVHAGDPITGVVRSSQSVCVFVRRRASWQHGVPDAFSEGKWVSESVVVNGNGPFTLPPVYGPLSYRGEQVLLEWRVVAESLDGPPTRTEFPFLLVAPRSTSYESEAMGGYRDRPTATTTLEPDFGEKHIEGPRRREDETNDGLALFSLWLGRALAAITHTDLGNVALDVIPSRVRAGEEVVAQLAFTTNTEIVIESITLQLIGREHWRFQREGEPILSSHVETITERVRLLPGPHTYEARLRVPANAAPSLAIATLAVEWFVRSTIQVDGQADIVREFVIGVAPF